MNDEIHPIVRVAQPVARGVGEVVIGPMIGAALASPEVRAGVWRAAVPVGVVIAGGVALGVIVGLLIGAAMIEPSRRNALEYRVYALWDAGVAAGDLRVQELANELRAYLYDEYAVEEVAVERIATLEHAVEAMLSASAPGGAQSGSWGGGGKEPAAKPKPGAVSYPTKSPPSVVAGSVGGGALGRARERWASMTTSDRTIAAVVAVGLAVGLGGLAWWWMRRMEKR